MASLKIIVKEKSVYGNILYYPVCDNAQLFARIVGSKTLTPKILTLIVKLGYEIELETPKVNFGKGA